MVASRQVRRTHVVMAMVAMVTAGCGQDADMPGERRGGAVAADCVILLRLGGATFREVAYGAAREGAALGDAEQSSCDDLGRHARGAFFAEDAPVVVTWEVRGQDPAEVIASIGSDGGLALYVAEDLPDAQQERLTSELSPGG